VRFTFRVDHPPKTKGRPRLGRKRKAYTPVETLEAEDLIRTAYRDVCGPTFLGNVRVTVDYDKTGQTITIEETSATSTLRGDVDNYMKLTLDALQGAAFENDKKVVAITAVKH